MANCDINLLMQQAQCFQCLSPGMLQLAELALLCQIMQNGGTGGGGGSGGNSDGVIDPVAAPTNVNVTNYYTNTAAVPKTFWIWPAGGAAWAQIV